jgi:hypothetical protein
MGGGAWWSGPHSAQVDRVDPVEDLGRLVGGVAGRNLDDSEDLDRNS